MTRSAMIKTLKRRRNFLMNRITASDKDLSYDKQECSALNQAIEELEEKQ